MKGEYLLTHSELFWVQATETKFKLVSKTKESIDSRTLRTKWPNCRSRDTVQVDFKDMQPGTSALPGSPISTIIWFFSHADFISLIEDQSLPPGGKYEASVVAGSYQSSQHPTLPSETYLLRSSKKKFRGRGTWVTSLV